MFLAPAPQLVELTAFARHCHFLREQAVFNQAVEAAVGANWSVSAAPAGPPELWAPGGPLAAVAWAAVPESEEGWPGGESIAGAPDYLFGRMCAVEVEIAAPAPALAAAPLLGASVPNGTRLEIAWGGGGGSARQVWGQALWLGYGPRPKLCAQPGCGVAPRPVARPPPPCDDGAQPAPPPDALAAPRYGDPGPQVRGRDGAAGGSARHLHRHTRARGRVARPGLERRRRAGGGGAPAASAPPASGRGRRHGSAQPHLFAGARHERSAAV